MKDLLSFFTRIPVGRGSAEPEDLYLLVLVAAVIAFLPTVVFLITEGVLPRAVVSILSILSIYSITGLIHTDGLSDFSDGIMKKGLKDEKIRAMKDVNTGTAGLFSLVVLILGEFYAISDVRTSFLSVLSFFLVSEVSAKFSMIVGLTIFPTPDSGLAHSFKMRARRYDIPLFLLISLPIALISWRIWLNVFAGGLISAVVGLVSVRNFSFVNGDALGAMNEISRVVTMWLICLGL
ncbi:MAG: adenosylcobinamide-GDP ribazoletransferase [Thermoplasmata archaeon]